MTTRRSDQDGTQSGFPGWDAAEGERLKDEGMGHAEQGADPGWITAAEEALRYVAEHYFELDTDLVWGVLVQQQVPAPPEPRALGPVMQRAVIQEWISPTGEYRKSQRPECHRRPIAIYHSGLFRL